MPITKRRQASPEDQKRLALALQEMKARGLNLPEEHMKKVAPKWSLNPNGYFEKFDGVVYTPTANQEAFIKCKARFTAFFGGRGSGKSAAASQKSMDKVKQGLSGTVLSPNFEHFKQSTWPEFRSWIDWNMVIPRQRHRKDPEWEPQKPFTMVFLNGVRVICKGLNNPDSARGPNLNWLWFDEAGIEETGMAWRIAIASVRIGGNPQAWISTTPKGKENWMYKFFVEKELPEDVLKLMQEQGIKVEELIEYFVGSIEENKAHLDPNFYLATVAAYPTGWLKSRELDGLFVDEGGVLGDAAWFTGKIWPQCLFEPKKIISYWDLAATEKKLTAPKKRTDPDSSCRTKLAWDGKKEFCILDQFSGQWEYQSILDNMAVLMIADGPGVIQYIEQEPGSGGINQIEAIKAYFKDLVKQHKLPWLPIIMAHDSRQYGDKVMRANIWFGEASQGQWTMVAGNWNAAFISQLASFPLAAHDDRIDSTSGARLAIAPVKKWNTTMKFVCV